MFFLNIAIFFINKDLLDYVQQVNLNKVKGWSWSIQIIIYQDNIKDLH